MLLQAFSVAMMVQHPGPTFSVCWGVGWGGAGAGEERLQSPHRPAGTCCPGLLRPQLIQHPSRVLSRPPLSPLPSHTVEGLWTGSGSSLSGHYPIGG